MTASRQEKKMTLKHRGKETLAMIQLKVTSMRGISYQKKGGGTIKYKGIRLNYIWVQYMLSPLQHLHMSSGHMMLKERNSFWAKIKSRVLSGKYGLKVKPVKPFIKTLERLKMVPQIPLKILRA